MLRRTKFNPKSVAIHTIVVGVLLLHHFEPQRAARVSAHQPKSVCR